MDEARQPVEAPVNGNAAVLRRVLDSLFTFVGVLTPEGVVLDVNRAPLEAAGLQAADVIGLAFWETYWWSHDPAVRETLRTACQRAGLGEPRRYDTHARMKGDCRMPIDFMVTPMRDVAGRISHLVVSGVDISARKRVEQDLQRLNSELEIRVERRTTALRESEARFRSAMHYSNIGMALVGLDGRWLDVNQALCALTGYDRAELLKSDFQSITHPADLETDLANVQQVLAGEIPNYQMEKRYLHKAGHVVWVMLSVSLVVNHEGTPQHFISQIQDITARKLTELAMEAISVELVALDGQDFLERAALRIAQILDADVAFVCSLDQFKPGYARSLAIVEDGSIVPNIHYALEGTPCLEVSAGSTLVVRSDVQQRFPQDDYFVRNAIQGYAAAPVIDLNGKILGHVCALNRSPFPRDLPIEQTLQIFGFAVAAAVTRDRSRQQYRDLFEFAPDAIVMTGRDGTIRLINRQAEVLFGWSREELTGQPIEVLLQDPDGGANLRDRLPDTSELGLEASDTIELNAMNKQGTRFPVDIRLRSVETEMGMMVAIAVRDVTERKAIEQQLRQSQRLDAVGKLTGGVAHDFNNLLTVILGNAEDLEEQSHGQPALQQIAATTKMAALRGADLTSRLLAFSRKQTLDPQPTDVKERLQVMESLLRRTIGEHIEIQLRIADAPWQALVDGPQLENAILNLCINARDAMPEGGLLIIETANRHVDEELAAQIGEIAAGDYLVLSISDTGIGMAGDTLAHAFEPFFTTKEVGKGSGLGLSMVYGFAKQSRGHIILYSEPGQGTTAQLYLPRAGGPPVVAGEDVCVVASRGSERILLVEDDDLVRDHVATQLSGLGYSVVAASSGPEALAILRRDCAFDLLFTDMVMPGGMTGRQLADQAQGLIPRLPVLFSSGYSESVIAHRNRLETGVHLLNKPYLRQELAAKIRDIFDPPA